MQVLRKQPELLHGRCESQRGMKGPKNGTLSCSSLNTSIHQFIEFKCSCEQWHNLHWSYNWGPFSQWWGIWKWCICAKVLRVRPHYKWIIFHAHLFCGITSSGWIVCCMTDKISAPYVTCPSMRLRSEGLGIPRLECMIGPQTEIHVTDFQRLVRELHSAHISSFYMRANRIWLHTALPPPRGNVLHVGKQMYVCVCVGLCLQALFSLFSLLTKVYNLIWASLTFAIFWFMCFESLCEGQLKLNCLAGTSSESGILLADDACWGSSLGFQDCKVYFE